MVVNGLRVALLLVFLVSPRRCWLRIRSSVRRVCSMCAAASCSTGRCCWSVTDGSSKSRATAPAAAAADATEIRLDGGMTLLPGLIDMHTHLDSDPSYGGYSGLEFSDRFWSALMVPNAGKTLDAGFTTVRNVGSGDWNDRRVCVRPSTPARYAVRGW